MNLKFFFKENKEGGDISVLYFIQVNVKLID